MNTDPRLLVSTGDLFEWLWPATFAASALASAWVLARAQARGLPLYAALACALAALFFPLVALPLFLSFLLLAPRRENDPDAPDATAPRSRASSSRSPRAADLSWKRAASPCATRRACARFCPNESKRT